MTEEEKTKEKKQFQDKVDELKRDLTETIGIVGERAEKVWQEVKGKTEEVAERVKKRSKGLTEEIFQKEREFVLGKRVSKDIKDKRGNVIIKKGSKVTNKVLSTAESAGRLHQLALSTGWQEITEQVIKAPKKMKGRAKEVSQEKEGERVMQAIFVVGRRVSRTIEDRRGNVLIKENQIVTKDIAWRAEKAGKLHELAAAVGWERERHTD